MQNILLVEDSNMFGRIAKKKIEKVFDVPVYWTKSLAETEKILEVGKGSFSMALLDVNLPDAPNGEVIDLVVNRGISSLVFTSNVSDEVRNLVWSKKVADYILKEDPNSLEYIVSAMQQLEKNDENLILVVDDSSMYRSMLSDLLYIRKYRVINGNNGEEGLDILDKYPEIKLVITDYNMPVMDGASFCQKIREKKKSDQLAIIGVSSEDDPSLGARFLKSGADDFIVKGGFLVEEFYSRVQRCLKQIDLFQQIRESAIRDFLTGLYNRRYFFEAGTELVSRCELKGEPLYCAIIDIDNFKSVNDTYGHDVGDIVIKVIAQSMRDLSREEDIVARIGGEEFCILGPVASVDDGLEQCETLRQHIAMTPVAVGDGGSLGVSVSTGVCFALGGDLDNLTKRADECLYRAKQNGKNRVEFVRDELK
ncbi:diguanylate cyclase [Desulfopila sp. IMCC35008]|uniref:GGDEF domain-containing response regulator n=1 Tax=Desulfopila sp. IMCC35008 TaxID=2653858 RepID=UPI0013D1535F|nr:diguanylate cyclase [Desulfopila sp. IMCC35008]